MLRLKSFMNAFIFVRQELAGAQIALFLSLTIGFSSVAWAETVPHLQVPASASSSKTIIKINPVFEYSSVFSGYSSFNDQALASWQKSNETVQKIGGWRAYAKEASAPESVAPSLHQPHKVDENKSKP